MLLQFTSMKFATGAHGRDHNMPAASYEISQRRASMKNAYIVYWGYETIGIVLK